MTNNSPITASAATPAGGSETPAVEDLDLTPDGLADAPAREQDPESLVHTGNS